MYEKHLISKKQQTKHTSTHQLAVIRTILMQNLVNNFQASTQRLFFLNGKTKVEPGTSFKSCASEENMKTVCFVCGCIFFLFFFDEIYLFENFSKSL